MPTYNKVIINGEEILNLDNDTVSSASQVASGVTFHLNNGEQTTGTGLFVANEYSINGSVVSNDANVSYTTDATSIGSYAFYKCTGLKSISLPQVTSIGKLAFDGCTNLTSITIKNGVVYSPGGLVYIKIATFNNHLYWQYGDTSNKIYISDAVAGLPTRTQIGVLTTSNPSFTYTDGSYTITFTRTGTDNNFSISWTETP